MPWYDVVQRASPLPLWPCRRRYGFCVFEDPNVVDIACAGLHGMRMGDRALTVRRADGGQRQAEAQQATTLAPPRVVKLAEAGARHRRRRGALAEEHTRPARAAR